MGLPAKHPDVVRRRNVRPAADTLPGRCYARGPQLPDTYAVAVKALDGVAHVPVAYHEETRAWYEALRRSPMAAAWTDADFFYVRGVLARLFDQMVQFGDVKAAGELRLHGVRLGLSPADRNGLGWKIDPSIVGTLDGPVAVDETKAQRATAARPAPEAGEPRAARSTRGRIAGLGVVDGGK